MPFAFIQQLLSMKGLFGSDFSTQGFSQHNALLPLAAIFGVWLIGGRMLRMVTGLVPMVIMVLFMMGTDRGVLKMLGLNGGISPAVAGGGDSMIDSLMAQGWFLPACVLLGIFLLGRGRLSFFQILIAICAGAYLLLKKDFRPSTFMAVPGSKLTILALLSLVLLVVLFRFLRASGRYRVAVPLGVQLMSLKPVLTYAAFGISALFGMFLLFTPHVIERSFPMWRSTVGVWIFCVALFALSQTLPAKYRTWMFPAFWCVVCLVIGAELLGGIRHVPAGPLVTF